MKVLLIENDPLFLSKFQRLLKREACIVEQSGQFQDAYRKLNNYEYDCILMNLDIIERGIQLAALLRKENFKTGILMIASNAGPESKIEALNAGADDFQDKSIHLGELYARMKAIVRRKTDTYQRVLIFGEMAIHLDERKVTISGEELKLTKKEYEILAYLAHNRNRIITKESIAEHLWGDFMENTDSFEFLYAHIKNLRKKLDANGHGDYLKTVYGVGYRFNS